MWDLERYKFFLRDTDFPSVHPSLQRISRLNMKVGLYKVKEGVYQVHGYDLATMIEEGVAKAEGDAGILDRLAVTFATFTPDFPMVPGTSEPPGEGEWNPYEAGVTPIRGE